MDWHRIKGMHFLSRCGLLTAVALLFWGTASGQDRSFALKSGDTVVFYGDSITDQRLYTTFVETFAITRFPRMPVRFVHSGWSGDRVTGGGGGGNMQTRLERDVFPYHPTVLTIMLGMNDGRYQPFDEAIFQEYAAGYQNIVRSARSALPGVRITVIQPSPYDDVTRPPLFPGGYNGVLVRYGAYLQDLAQKESLAVADMNTPVVEDLKSANKLDAAAAAKLIPDRVHPGAGGHLLMAKALLKAWGAPPLVSSVEIDGGKGKLIRTDHAEVTDLQANRSLTWTQTDDALPMPVNSKDAGIALAVRASDVQKSLNQQPLKVTGLKAGRWALSIDSEPVGVFTSEQLADGINLAMLPTPMAKQAADVHTLTLKHNNIHFARWRQVQVPLEKEGLAQTAPAMAALDSLEEELVRKQRALAQPKPHRFELLPEAGAAN